MASPGPSPDNPSPAVQAAQLFLTPQEVADALRLSRLTVYRLINIGIIPATKVGDRVRIPARFVEERDADAWSNVAAPTERGA